MPIPLTQLKTFIDPTNTALVLGAGASVPSGAPTGQRLAHRLWRTLQNCDPLSDDLVETATILSRRHSRLTVVNEIVKSLRSLKPTGGLLGLPLLHWKTIFSTNFDRLVEDSYKACGIDLVTIRSNFDFTNREQDQGTRLFKIHGCISQDREFGHKASMTLTEQDYESHQAYRQILFTRLADTLLSGSVLIVGQSLADRHLSELVKDALSIKDKHGAPGAIYVLVFDKDDLRAPLLEDRGAKIAFGGIDEFLHEMATVTEPDTDSTLTDTDILPLSLISTVLDVNVERRHAASTMRMFNGAAARFSDIASGATFERHNFRNAFDAVTQTKTSIVIVGAAGVGKTTFARQLGNSLCLHNYPVWEHKADFFFQHKPWLTVERQLRERDAKGFLILDECTHYLRQTNLLIDRLAEIEKPALRIIMTANSAQWAPRLKSRNIYEHGLDIHLSRLEDSEIYSLLNLADHNSDVARLVHEQFRLLSRDRQFDELRRKASADMFVCLKNIFANENLDTILLREYEDLDESCQEYYRFVSALEAVGTRVHRQLLIRMRSIPLEQIGYALQGLTDIIEEYDIDTRQGIFGWRTRHLVVARKIAEYKFSSIPELVQLFEDIIDNLNPAVPIEMRTIRDICDVEYGIGRIGDKDTRKRLYRRLIEAAPGERIPWHRLIRELLEEGNLEETEYTIRSAEEAAGSDAPIDRYRVRLLMTRARQTEGISDSDRLALLRRAYELARSNIDRHVWDKYSYFTLCDVAVQAVRYGESEYLLKEAVSHAREAADRILDPDMARRVDEYERALRRQ